MPDRGRLYDDLSRGGLLAAAPEEVAPVRVLLADDSVLVRTILRAALTAATPALPPQFSCQVEICGVARDGIDCLEQVRKLSPDVLILDIEMPRMDGLTVLTHLKSSAPDMPVIMFSSLTAQGARTTLEALARGAADYVTKPSGQADLNSSIAEMQRQLLPKIAGLARSFRKKIRPGNDGIITAKLGEPPLRLAGLPAKLSPVEAVVIGVSTGGPRALERLLPQLPADFPAAVLIVQHMPAIFTEMLAQRLDSLCPLQVREAENLKMVAPGSIWIAKGDWHMKLQRRDPRSRTVQIRLEQSEMEHYSRPAVDVLFRSAGEVYGAGALGVVMTGMGRDGAAGALAMHRCGGTVIAQDEASSTVWGMPRRAMENGSVYGCMDVDGIAQELLRRVMHSEARHAV
jgi:two-component system chemotaxis response regulator CheB